MLTLPPNHHLRISLFALIFGAVGCAVDPTGSGGFGNTTDEDSNVQMFIVDWASEADAIRASGILVDRGNLCQPGDTSALCGLHGADEICRQRASAAGLEAPERFRALMSVRDASGEILYDFFAEHPHILDRPLANATHDVAIPACDDDPSCTEDNSRTRTLNDMRNRSMRIDASWDAYLFYRADGTRLPSCSFAKSTGSFDIISGILPDGSPGSYESSCDAYTSVPDERRLAELNWVFDHGGVSAAGPDNTVWDACTDRRSFMNALGAAGDHRCDRFRDATTVGDGLFCVDTTQPPCQPDDRYVRFQLEVKSVLRTASYDLRLSVYHLEPESHDEIIDRHRNCPFGWGLCVEAERIWRVERALTELLARQGQWLEVEVEPDVLAGDYRWVDIDQYLTDEIELLIQQIRMAYPGEIDGQLSQDVVGELIEEAYRVWSLAADYEGALGSLGNGCPLT